MYGSIHMINFKCYEEQLVILKDGRKSVLNEVHIVGENATGKSSFLSVFSFLIEISLLAHHNSFVEEYRLGATKLKSMREKVIDSKNKFSTSGLYLKYEIIIDKTIFFYTLKFDNNNNINSETLTRIIKGTEKVIFSRNKDKYTISSGVIRKDDYLLFNEYFVNNKDRYTLMSMLHYNVTRKYVRTNSVMRSIFKFLTFQNINNDYHGHEDFYNLDKKYDRSPIEGRANKAYVTVVQATSTLLKSILKSFYPSIYDIKYKYEKVGPNLYDYRLYIAFEKNNKIVWMSKENWPESYKTVIETSNALNDSAFNHFISIDNFEKDLHYHSIIKFLEKFNKYSKEQRIFSTRLSNYLNEVDPNSIFFTKIVEGKFIIENLVKDHYYRSEHNVKDRYEKGMYGEQMAYEKPALIKHKKMIDSFTPKYLDKIMNKYNIK